MAPNQERTTEERVAVLAARTLAKLYQNLALPIIKSRFSPEDADTGANEAHEWAMKISEFLDNHPQLAQPFLREFYRLIYQPQEGEYKVGGVLLPTDLILAAGWVKGRGFANESEALKAVEEGVNIIPGYASISQLTGGAVEFGSYTRWPREGNPHPSMWRQEPGSAQNRVGLTNPGVKAAAKFLSKSEVKEKLPEFFGINIAISPGLDNLEEEVADVQQSFAAFLDAGVFPTWFTLNISCPNTEDDPEGNQTDEKVRALCRAALEKIEASESKAPLWVKVSPNLGEERYAQLYEIFSEVGVEAIIATNTRGEPAPHDPELTAGVSGQTLHQDAVAAAQSLLRAKQKSTGREVGIIGCGGVIDGASYLEYYDEENGVEVAARQYLTALFLRGPTAAALIHDEAEALQ